MGDRASPFQQEKGASDMNARPSIALVHGGVKWGDGGMDSQDRVLIDGD
jgi:hypothetical protein